MPSSSLALIPADAPYLASVDLLGTTFSAPSLATGYGSHLAQPILRKLVPDEESSKNLSQEDAIKVIRECMKVLFYRDARSLDRYSIGVITKEGVTLHEDEKLENQSWAFAERIRGYGNSSSLETVILVGSENHSEVICKT